MDASRWQMACFTVKKVIYLRFLAVTFCPVSENKHTHTHTHTHTQTQQIFISSGLRGRGSEGVDEKNIVCMRTNHSQQPGCVQHLTDTFVLRQADVVQPPSDPHHIHLAGAGSFVFAAQRLQV